MLPHAIAAFCTAIGTAAKCDSYIDVAAARLCFESVASAQRERIRPPATNPLPGNDFRTIPPLAAAGAPLALTAAMTFALMVDRARADFMEMPGLELTLPQAVRLWHLGADDCRVVLDALVDLGFLRWTAKRTVVRTGRVLRRDIREAEYVSVYARRGPDNSVAGA